MSINNNYLNMQSKDAMECYRCKGELHYSTYSAPRDSENLVLLEEKCGFPAGPRPSRKGKKQDAHDAQFSLACERLNEIRHLNAGEALRWQDTGGYGGSWDRCVKTLVLCEKCTFEVLGDWIRINDIGFRGTVSKDEFHYHRRAQRKPGEIEAKWDARRLARATIEPAARAAARRI